MPKKSEEKAAQYQSEAMDAVRMEDGSVILYVRGDGGEGATNIVTLPPKTWVEIVASLSIDGNTPRKRKRASYVHEIEETP